MKHITLSSGEIIRNEKQVAAEFSKVHADNEKTKADLEKLKSIIKENEAFNWLLHGIKLNCKSPTSWFDKKTAIELLSKFGLSKAKIKNLTKHGTTKRVDLIKKSST
jgi:hypothetical protein